MPRATSRARATGLTAVVALAVAALAAAVLVPLGATAAPVALSGLVVSPSGSINMRKPRGGRPLVRATSTRACRSSRTARAARSVSTLSGVSKVPSTSMIISRTPCITRPRRGRAGRP